MCTSRWMTANFLDRTTRGHQLSVHLPAGQADSDPHPDRQHDELQRVERRTVSVALVRPDLHDFGQLHLDQGQPHVEVRLLLREVGRERQRRNQRQRLPHLHQQPERPVHLHRYPLRTAHHRQRDGKRRAGPVRHLLRTRPARLHDLPRQHVRAFAQDSWKATQKLHIDYGVRYTVIVPYKALWRNMAVSIPSSTIRPRR